MTKIKEEVQAEYSMRNKMEAEMVYNLAMYIAESEKESPDSLEYRIGAVFVNAINRWFTDVWLARNSDLLLDILETSSKKKDWLDDKYGNEYRVSRGQSPKTLIVEYKLTWGCRDVSFVFKYSGRVLLYIMRDGVVVLSMFGADSAIQAGYLLDSLTYLDGIIPKKTDEDKEQGA